MASVKYKQYFVLMQEQNQALFKDFLKIHQLYELAADQHEAEFNQVGQKVVEVVRDWDRRLCSAMGRGMYSQYAQRLSEKFWDEVKKMFPLIHSVGVKTIKK